VGVKVVGLLVKCLNDGMFAAKGEHWPEPLFSIFLSSIVRSFIIPYSFTLHVMSSRYCNSPGTLIATRVSCWKVPVGLNALRSLELNEIGQFGRKDILYSSVDPTLWPDFLAFSNCLSLVPRHPVTIRIKGYPITSEYMKLSFTLCSRFL
jgi:hypothetical protein